VGNRSRAILVTGGCGFIGQAVVNRLADMGHAVIVADREKPARTREDVEYAQLDITRGHELRRIAKGMDSIVHCASVVTTRGRDRGGAWRHNYGGTRSVLDACEYGRVDRLVHISSASVVYQGRDIENGDEHLPYATARTPYASSKIAAERAVLDFANASSRTRACAIRPSLVFGPGDTRLVPGILREAPPTWYACRARGPISVNPALNPVGFAFSESGRRVERTYPVGRFRTGI